MFSGYYAQIHPPKKVLPPGLNPKHNLDRLFRSSNNGWIITVHLTAKTTSPHTDNSLHPIAHYLLLPLYEWGVSDWHLDVAKPFIKKHMLTVGFSVSEAVYAAQVTVIGGPQTFPEETLQFLRDSGCTVERISGDGTSIATLLAER